MRISKRKSCICTSLFLTTHVLPQNNHKTSKCQRPLLHRTDESRVQISVQPLHPQPVRRCSAFRRRNHPMEISQCVTKHNPHSSMLNGGTLPSLKRASPSLNIYFFIIIRGVLHRGRRDFMWSESWQLRKGGPCNRKVPGHFHCAAHRDFSPVRK